MRAKTNHVYRLEKIVSGGQTGADRAALEFALAKGIPHGGWCPLGRFAEDGKIPRRFAMQETTEPSYAQRTEWNVRDSDGTLIFSKARVLSGGSRVTAVFASKHRKPCLHLAQDREDIQEAAGRLLAFLVKHKIKVLNVAGPRASTEPRIGVFVRAVLSAAVAAE